MIYVLGTKRLIILGALIVINVLVGSLTYFYLVPRGVKLSSELTAVTGSLTQKRGETERLRLQFSQINDQKALFQVLETTGFFSDQNRASASKRIDDIQQFIRILSVKYNIKAAEVIQSEKLAEPGYVILRSPIEVNIDAMDDIDIYNFVYWMENTFSGYLTLKELKLERASDINEAILRQIGNGVSAPLIKASLVFSWSTLIKKAPVDPNAAPEVTP